MSWASGKKLTCHRCNTSSALHVVLHLLVASSLISHAQDVAHDDAAFIILHTSCRI